MERQVGCIPERRLFPSSLPQDWGRVRERVDAAVASPITYKERSQDAI
jgi:hypothetical protein